MVAAGGGRSSPVRRWVQPAMSNDELRATVREHALRRLEATERSLMICINPSEAAAKGLRFKARRTNSSILSGLSADANADDELADINTGLSENDDTAAAVHNLTERFHAFEQSSRIAQRNHQRGRLLQQTQLDRLEGALAALQRTQAEILRRLPIQPLKHDLKLPGLGAVRPVANRTVPLPRTGEPPLF